MNDSILPPLHAILDVDVARRAGWAPEDLARAFLDGGARLIQIRAKQLPSGPLLDLCDSVVAAATAFGAAVIVNDRVDLARLSAAAGVHVGQDDLPPAAARAQLGDDAIVGLSTHSIEQLDAARSLPVTYLAVGPVFGTATKDTGYDAVGLGLVGEAVRWSAGLPIVAIGGITLETAASVWRAGATSVAVIGDLLAGDGPAARVASYNRLASAVLGG
jgi:thiamine-phosphate pyrophosphorylase